VEFLSIFVLEETSHSPGIGVDKELMEEILFNTLLLLNIWLENSCEKVEHLVDSNYFRLRHHVSVIFGSDVKSIHFIILNVFLSELVHPIVFLNICIAFDLLSILAPGVN
jgi:hypothetical protein